MSCYRNSCDRPAAFIIDWSRYGKKEIGRRDKSSWDKICAEHSRISRPWGNVYPYP